jgi:hypothetical protein
MIEKIYKSWGLTHSKNHLKSHESGLLGGNGGPPVGIGIMMRIYFSQLWLSRLTLRRRTILPGCIGFGS